ncbi:hypothetical protein SDC9_137172 [bioreactor metagenome]|uniref:Uncharacterized protein n=1 Tax=bioreactor metagenome TaxID=1076179 RepID=A0A645DL59_9ZZZZ
MIIFIQLPKDNGMIKPDPVSQLIVGSFYALAITDIVVFLQQPRPVVFIIKGMIYVCGMHIFIQDDIRFPFPQRIGIKQG